MKRMIEEVGDLRRGVVNVWKEKNVCSGSVVCESALGKATKTDGEEEEETEREAGGGGSGREAKELKRNEDWWWLSDTVNTH